MTSFKDQLTGAVMENGPMVVESITCVHCRCVQIAIHPFCESVECLSCGKRNASNVPVYNDEPFGDE